MSVSEQKSSARRVSREERNLQLLEAAREIVSEEGMQALTHISLGKRAGCTRALVYHHFPRRADIFIAIVEAFYREFDQLIDVEEQRRVMEVVPENEVASTHLFTLIFELLEQHRLVPAILVNTPKLDADLEEFESELKQRFEKRWLAAYRKLGISSADGRLLLANTYSVTTNVFVHHQSGKISRKKAIEKIRHLVTLLIRDAMPIS